MHRDRACHSGEIVVGLFEREFTTRLLSDLNLWDFLHFLDKLKDSECLCSRLFPSLPIQGLHDRRCGVWGRFMPGVSQLIRCLEDAS